MTEQEFLDILTDLLDTEEDLTMETQLESLEEWDSLSKLMFQSKMMEKAKGKLAATDIAAAKTVADLYQLLQGVTRRDGMATEERAIHGRNGLCIRFR